MSFEINWEELSPEQCEDLITALLTELHPSGRRIDGRGGDGGRDYEVPATGGWHRYEVKSWAREFGRSQRRQLKASLATTLKTNPVKVTIVVPLDQTPPMVAWLDRQQATTPVPLEWRGRTWLETQLACRPHLVRAFVRTSLERTLERLAEYHAEQAALANGMPDAIERAQRLQARTDEIDPHYRFAVQTTPDQTTITIIPRTQRSLEERPMTFSVRFAFPTGDPHAAETMAALERAFDFGDAVVVPPEYVAGVHASLPAGLGGDLPGGARLALAPTGQIPWGTDGRVVLVDAAGRALQQLAVRFGNFAVGERGFIIDIQDLTGSLAMRLRGPKGIGEGGVEVRFTPGEHAFPADMLGPLRLLDALGGAARLRLLAGAQELCNVRVTPHGELVTGALGLVEALARIQERTGVLFAMPRQLTAQEIHEIALADTLLREGQARLPGAQVTLTLTRQQARELLAAFPSGRIVLCNPNEPFAVHIAGHQMPLGLVSIHTACAHLDVTALRRQLARRPQGAGDQLVELAFAVHPADGPIARLVA